MGDYTPSTDEVREMWVWEQNATIGLGEDAHGAEFDRMLDARDAARDAEREKAVRERIAQDIKAQARQFDQEAVAPLVASALNHAARIAREEVAP